jgi:alkylhydroperoxidase family enzyme
LSTAAAPTALEHVEWEECLLEPRVDLELEAEVRRQLGAVPSSTRFLARSPWIVPSILRLLHYSAPIVHTPFALADLVSLVVSQDNSCRYCYATQRTLMRLQGVPERRIPRLEQDFLRAELDPRERVALDFARRLSRGSPLADGADWRRMVDTGFAPDEIREVALIAATNVYMNRLTTLPAVPPQRIESIAARRFLRFAAPVTRRIVQRHLRRSEPVALPDHLRGGAYGYVVGALSGLPAAVGLRRTIDDALASPVLGRRAKLLACAVIAHGLGCELGAVEARRLLRDEGVGEREIDEVLAHLGAPWLDADEAAIVPFARETIRFRPAHVQRRAREVRDRVGQDKLLEAIGVTSLANALCRLGVVVGR